MSALLHTLPIPAGTAVTSVLPTLERVLDGSGPPLLPVPEGDPKEIARLTRALHPDEPIDDVADAEDVALVGGDVGNHRGAQGRDAHLARAARER